MHFRDLIRRLSVYSVALALRSSEAGATRIPVILDHENVTAKIASVKTLYPVLYDYSYFRKELFLGITRRIVFF